MHALLQLGAVGLLGLATVPAQERAVQQAAARIDALIEADLAAAGLGPNPRADDQTFVRRAYLTIVGRTPTLDELAALGDLGDGRGRDRLVDRLLESPGRVSHDFNLWADVLRLQSRMMRRISGEPYAHFLRQALADGLSYDDLVRQLLVAEGPAHEPGNGATGYWLRDLGMPLDAMSNTMRVFLGTRMECAQCHDHPFDRWTQKQFYELSAFTGGVRYSTLDPRAPEDRQRIAAARALRGEFGDAGRRVLRRLQQDVGTGLAGTGVGAIRLPKDYAYDDAAPGEVVLAHAPFGDQPTLDEVRLPTARRDARGRDRPLRLPDVGSRAAFAAWVTSPENPRFTTVIVNRMWKQVFGVGLLDPVDDIRDQTESSNPALSAYLEQLMRELDYDLLAFRRRLLHTRTFSRQAGTWEAELGTPYRFPGPLLRRMSAEQMWDSLLGLALGDVDLTLRAPGDRAAPIYARFDELSQLTGGDLRGFVEREALRYSDPAAYRRQQAQRGAAARTQRQTAARSAREETQRLQRALRAARRRGDEQEAMNLMVALRAHRDQTRVAAARGGSTAVRASELPQPAPAGHFVREWGQSDRGQIAASSTEANVPQALQLLNGVVDGRLLRPDSALMVALSDARTVDDRITTAFRAVLGRPPRSDERARWRRDFARDGEALEDLVWTLVNCHEFRFVQ